MNWEGLTTALSSDILGRSCRIVNLACVGFSALCVLAVGLFGDTFRLPVRPPGAGPLFQIHYGAKWGYMNRAGKTVIAPQFDDEGDFFEGLAKIRQGHKWGYVDEAGRVAIPAQFEYAGDFAEGLAPVQVERKWGFVDTRGRLAIRAQFQAASGFSDGLARFEVWETVDCDPSAPLRGRTTGIYTSQNAPLYAFRIHLVPEPSCVPLDARFGFVDKTGRVSIAPTFPLVYDFHEGLASFSPNLDSRARKWGYIDKTGSISIRPRFDDAGSFSEGLAAAEIGFTALDGKKTGGQYGFINRQGWFVVPPRFESAYDFSEGLAGVCPHFGGCGYVNRRGVFVIAPEYGEVRPFSEGLALLPDDDCYIDKTGRKVLEIEMALFPFSGGLTVVGQVGERKYVDKTGTVVAPYEVDPYVE